MKPRGTKREGGQALAVVLGIVAILVAVPVAVVAGAVGTSVTASTAVLRQDALQAAQAGLAAYRSALAADPGLAFDGCAEGPAGSSAPPTCTLDPTDPAVVSSLDPAACPSSTTTTAGWVDQTGGTDGLVSGYRMYVDDTDVVDPPIGSPPPPAELYVTVLGRAGSSGHFTCQSVRAALAVLQPTVTTTVSAGTATATTAGSPSVPTEATVVLDGASGAPGTGVDLFFWQLQGGGPAGRGAQVTTTVVVPAGDAIGTSAGQAGRPGAGG
ncbi:hypothetical protein ACFFRE_03545, partial [Aciditerrimonas ferrireducens]